MQTAQVFSLDVIKGTRLILRSDVNLLCHTGVGSADDEGIHSRPKNKRINKPTDRLTHIYSLVAAPKEDVSEALITHRNELRLWARSINLHLVLFIGSISSLG